MEQVNAGLHFRNGEKYALIKIDALTRLQKEIEYFKTTEDLNDFQRWIVEKLYHFELPQAHFPIESILLIAVPHPMYAKVTLAYGNKKHSGLSLVSSDFDQTRDSLKSSVQDNDIEILEAKNLPLKRLAVHSGFAKYGKNNITYIDGLGSQFSYMAFFTNIACNESQWLDVNHSAACETCNICASACPTGAIRKERFLIDNRICLSCLNESEEPFPDWLPQSVHHALYDCLRCQMPCPMNKEHINNIGAAVEFDNDETQLLLSGIHYENCPEPLKLKAKYLGLDQWPEGVAKNIKILIERNR